MDQPSAQSKPTLFISKLKFSKSHISYTIARNQNIQRRKYTAKAFYMVVVMFSSTILHHYSKSSFWDIALILTQIKSENSNESKKVDIVFTQQCFMT